MELIALTSALKAFTAKRARLADIDNKGNEINRLTNLEVLRIRKSRALELKARIEIKKLDTKYKP